MCKLLRILCLSVVVSLSGCAAVPALIQAAVPTLLGSALGGKSSGVTANGQIGQENSQSLVDTGDNVRMSTESDIRTGDNSPVTNVQSGSAPVVKRNSGVIRSTPVSRDAVVSDTSASEIGNSVSSTKSQSVVAQPGSTVNVTQQDGMPYWYLWVGLALSILVVWAARFAAGKKNKPADE
jgi:hypothetical protein